MIDGNCTWDEFKTRTAELLDEAEGSKVLFRGHGSSKWELQTTLERSQHPVQIEDYYLTINKIRTEIRTYTGQSWPDDIDFSEIQAKLRGGYDSFSRLMTFGSFP